MYWRRISFRRVRHCVGVMVGFDSSWRMTFYSGAGDFCVRSMSLGSFRFSVTVVKLFSGPLEAAR